MSITTYSELQTKMAEWLRRDADTNLVNQIPTLISLAEAQFNRDIRHRRMETVTTLTLTAANNTVPLPTDYVEVRTAVVQTSPKSVMTYVTPSQLELNWAGGSSGIPTEYTIINGDLRVGETPDSGYDVELIYYQRIPALTDAAPTNWLLTYHSDLYLYGGLLQTMPFLSDDERIPVWGAFYDRAREGLKDDANRSAYNGGPLYSRVRVYTG